MRVYPNSALQQLELPKVIDLLTDFCRTAYGKQKSATLRLHTLKAYVEKALHQSHEMKLILQSSGYFPNDFTHTIDRELKLLSIPGALLGGDQFVLLRKLAINAENIFRWFDQERRSGFPYLSQELDEIYYEKQIVLSIDEVLDELGQVKDHASDDLARIRQQLYRRRQELRRVFDKVIAKLSKAGYTADIEESFSTGRRVVAVFAEHKRQIKGILHGESDSRKTAFIEPEETIELNNEVFSLEQDEQREVQKILRQLTATLSVYSSLLLQYYELAGEFDFIAAKAKLAIQMNANLPELVDDVQIDLKKAYHPLLWLYNQQAGKTTHPVNIHLNQQHRILVISGPNAGGKTVTMKTIGLNQLMLQAGLLVPVHPTSRMGLFKQLFIHIGDTQSIEFDLSTYSSHLMHMKHFIELSNGKTLFFIDELGSGSDPHLGGAFAEVIMEELARKKSLGVVTTHYLNLKVMANHTPGIVNGAMLFDEQTLSPLYQLTIGKPGSSYTFSIAERIGMPKRLIDRARNLVDQDHFKLDKLLNRTEQDLQKVVEEKKKLENLVKENERLKKEMQVVMDKERHRQQVEVLKQQNRVTEERIAYLKDMERKLRQVVIDWKKTEEKQTVIKHLKDLLFKKDTAPVVSKAEKKIQQQYQEIDIEELKPGMLVKLKKNYQVGEIKEIRGKKAIVQIGQLPMQLSISDLVAVKKIIQAQQKKVE